MENTKGISVLFNPRLNKGPAFSPEARKKYDLTGLLPDVAETMETQLIRNISTILSISVNVAIKIADEIFRSQLVGIEMPADLSKNIFSKMYQPFYK